MARRRRAYGYRPQTRPAYAPTPLPEDSDSKNKRLAFGSLSELLQYLKKNDEMFHGESYSRTGHRGESWSGASYEDASRMLEAGWPEGSAKIDLRIGNIARMREAEEHPEYQHEVQGEFLDVGHYLSGQPDCFMTTVPVSFDRQEVNVAVNTFYSASVSPEKIMNRGAVIMTVIDELRREYAVNVKIMLVSSGLPQSSNLYMTLNMDTSTDYSRDLICFCVAHPAWFRRIMFGFEEIVYKNDSLVSWSYGFPLDITPDENTVYFPCLQSREEHKYSSIESSTAEVQRILTETEQRLQAQKIAC
jgi:hypothetical protein